MSQPLRTLSCFAGIGGFDLGLERMCGGFETAGFVEWLMGYPDGWTDLSSLEMPLYPRSRPKSDDAS